MKLINIIFTGILFMLSGCQRENPLVPSDHIPEYISLYDLQKQNTGNLNSYLISGIVISDRANHNTEPNTLILQEEVTLKVPEGEPAVRNFGIKLVFDKEHSFKMGDKIEVDISKLILTNEEGLMSIKAIPLTKAVKIGSGKVNVQFVNVEEVTKNFKKYAYQLISLADGKFTGSGRLTEPLLYTESETSLPLTILNTASFKNDEYSENMEMLEGILTYENNKPGLTIRNKDDIRTTDVTRVEVDNFDKLLPVKDPYSIENVYKGFYTNFTVSGSSGNYLFFSLRGGTGADAGFTTPKDYLYLGLSDNTTSGYYSVGYYTFQPLKGNFNTLRTITVTFAGSKVGPSDKITHAENTSLKNGIYTYDNYYSYYNKPQLESYVQISLSTRNEPYPMEVVSDKYTDTGVWHIVTFKVPTKREMLEKGVSQATIDDFMNSSEFSISNMSMSREGPQELIDTTTEQGSNYIKNVTTRHYGYNPIIISKIEYGYSK